MRKNESLQEEAARKQAEAELPIKAAQCLARLRAVAGELRTAADQLKARHEANAGGERNGTLG